MELMFILTFKLMIHDVQALAWAVSQHTDNSKNTKATSKCCYALHTYVETIFSSDKFHAEQHPPSRNGDKSPEDDTWLPMWRGNKTKRSSHTQSSHHME